MKQFFTLGVLAVVLTLTGCNQIRNEEMGTLLGGALGGLLTRDGGLAHLRLAASYEVDSPVDFARTTSQQDVDRAGVRGGD